MTNPWGPIWGFIPVLHGRGGPPGCSTTSAASARPQQAGASSLASCVPVPWFYGTAFWRPEAPTSSSSGNPTVQSSPQWLTVPRALGASYNHPSGYPKDTPEYQNHQPYGSGKSPNVPLVSLQEVKQAVGPNGKGRNEDKPREPEDNRFVHKPSMRAAVAELSWRGSRRGIPGDADLPLVLSA
jgi:hypothetical protein